MKFDDLQANLGGLGRYQQRLLIVCSVAMVFVAWQNFLAIFTLAKPKYRCALPDYANDTYALQGPEHMAMVKEMVPTGKNGQWGTCTLYSNVSLGNQTTQCHAWVYDKSEFKTTLTEKLNIVCDNTLVSTHSYMVMFAGKFCAGTVQGVFSDLFGRRRVFLLAALLIIAASFVGAVVENTATLLLSRFLAAFSGTAVYLSAYVIAIELVGPSGRRATGVVVRCLYVVGNLSLGGLAYLLRDWRLLTLTVAAPTVILLPAWWILPESPRWLLSRGRREEAEAVIRNICKVNKIRVEESWLQELTVERPSSFKPWTMFSSPRLAARFLIIYFNWTVVSMTYYGLTLNVSNLSGDLFLNYTLSSLVELLSLLFCYLTLDRMGRKLSYCLVMLLAGFALIATVVPIVVRGPATNTVLNVLSLVGKFGAASCFVIVYLYTAELWPTVLRNFGMGSSSTLARLGAMVSPYIADLGVLVGGKFGDALPLVVFGGFALMSGGLSLLLPETLEKQLPETVQDAKDFGREKSTSSKENAKEREMTKF